MGSNDRRDAPALEDLNIKVDYEFHRQFTMTASAWGMSPEELHEACFEYWLEIHGATPPAATSEE